MIQPLYVKQHVTDGGAKKYDSGKERFDLIPPDSLFQIARVFTMGAGKYGDRNWEKGMAWGRVFAAVMRHLWKWWRGEAFDDESGLSHLAHAAWGCLVLMEYSRLSSGVDDRGKQ